MRRKVLSFIVAAASLSGIGSPAYALPFQPNAASFTKYINSLDWEDGKKRTFSGLRGCEYSDFTGTMLGLQFYKCRHGYVKIQDPVRGGIFCELQPIHSPLDGIVIHSSFGGSSGPSVKFGNTYPCRKS